MLSICLNRDASSYFSILSTWKHCPRDAVLSGQKADLKLCVLVDKLRKIYILVNRD